MRAPAFWWRRDLSLPATLLRPAAALYGAVAASRMRRSGERVDIPVVCIGNFTLGGAGKTPAALAVARLLAEAGEPPFFLTRGYGGQLAGPVRVDPAVHGAKEVGDEPLLLARAAPTIVGRERPAGARLAIAEGASVVIMDDGLQNPSLTKDLAVAVVDGATGLGNGLCFPAGPLRAAMAAQWPHVGAVIVVGYGTAGARVTDEAERRGKTVISARLVPDPAVAARLHGRPVLAFAGIGRPEKFFETLRACGAKIVATRAFADHHPYAAEDIRRLAAEAAAKALALVTTEKDLVRIAGLSDLTPSEREIEALPVRLVFDDEEAARALLSHLSFRGSLRAKTRNPQPDQSRGA
jgi:tetraacyldisaccharide 4'-kinase